MLWPRHCLFELLSSLSRKDKDSFVFIWPTTDSFNLKTEEYIDLIRAVKVYDERLKLNMAKKYVNHLTIIFNESAHSVSVRKGT